MAPTSRLLTLLSLLQSRRDWPGAVLADRLEITPRTVRRDVDRLREMGYRITATMGPDGGYRLDAGTALPPLLFDDDQAVALAIALQTAATSGAGIEEAALRALTTVRQVLPPHLRRRLDSFDVTALRTAGSTVQAAPDVLTDVSAAVRDREVLRLDYAGDSDAGSRPLPPRRVEPHHVVTANRRWYLVGWDLDRQDWRILRLDRVSLRTPNGPRFSPREVPGGDVSAYVGARFKGSAHGDQWPCQGSVILDLPAEQVGPFAGDAVVEPLGNRCRITAGSWSWISLAAALGRFDADLRDARPAELAEAFTQLAARCAGAGEPED